MYTSRANQQQIFDAFSNPYITGLLGQRQVGKTTLVEHYASLHPGRLWVFLNMDKMAERIRIESGELQQMIEECARQNIGAQEKIWVVIDEAQKCPAIFEQVKVIYDTFKGKQVIKFILTSSGLLSLHRLSAESLAGRVYLYYLREFGLHEIFAFNEKTGLLDFSTLEAACDKEDYSLLEQRIKKLSPLRPFLENYLSYLLVWGGLPEILSFSNNDERITYLANYLQTYLEKDVRAITNISDLDLYRRLMAIAAEQTGSVRNEQKVVQILDCARDTVKKYRSYLEATLLYKELYPFIGSALRRLTKSPKCYLLNNGLISYLTGIYDLDVMIKTGLIGHRLENWFLNELQIWLDRTPHKSQLYFWQTSGNVEVDFIIEKNQKFSRLRLCLGSK